MLKPILFLIILFLCSFTNTGEMSYYYNNQKIAYNHQATQRKITTGAQQISLSNEQWQKFTFFNPKIQRYPLPSNNQELIIRIEDKNGNIGKPISGWVEITKLDEQMIEGNFNMVIQFTNPVYQVKINQGHFKLPIKRI